MCQRKPARTCTSFFVSQSLSKIWSPTKSSQNFWKFGNYLFSANQTRVSNGHFLHHRNSEKHEMFQKIWTLRVLQRHTWRPGVFLFLLLKSWSTFFVREDAVRRGKRGSKCTKCGNTTLNKKVAISGRCGIMSGSQYRKQMPQWKNIWMNCSVSSCHWESNSSWKNWSPLRCLVIYTVIFLLQSIERTIWHFYSSSQKH